LRFQTDGRRHRHSLISELLTWYTGRVSAFCFQDRGGATAKRI
jgi:hypothetical protein